ncbi:MAG TPA: ABC transporter ATP-binding protein [Bacteroidota bacterium]
MLKLENVSFTYKDGTHALRRMSFEAQAGEFLLILGHNGAGKSTFLRLLNGILKPTDGRLTVGGLDTMAHSPARLAKEVAVTFQNPRDQIFASTVEREIAFGPTILQRLHATELTIAALQQFGFTAERASHPYDLPPSRQKLLSIASAVAMDSAVLAFDEPSAGLSVPERQMLTKTFSDLRRNRLLLVVSHDLDLFLPLATRVFIFQNGTLTADVAPTMMLHNEKMLRKATLKLPLSLRLRKAFDLPSFRTPLI